jgi:hypothetical protein
LFCGACSGITSSLITFPFDVIRRRLQVFVLVTSNELDIAKNQVITKKASAIGEFRKIVKAEGILGMYRGILPELLKVSYQKIYYYYYYYYNNNCLFNIYFILSGQSNGWDNLLCL